MQKSLVALSTVAALGLFACQPNTEEKADTVGTEMAEVAENTTESMTDVQKQAYAMGASMGLFVANRAQQQEQLGFPLDEAALKEGFEDGLNDSLKFTPQEIQQIAQQGEEILRAKQQEMAQKAATDNIEAGAAYLEENGKKEGVTTTESGLQYEVLEEGEGASPAAEDIVKVHYRGTLLDGTEFDSSYKRGEPAEFPLNQVIPGWTEGVQLMKEGAKYRFHIPSELAYGERATGSITPNSTLIFDVELLEVVKEDAAE
ncbi:FKBP-type peptidyl-prolyl cis-trans isomerase [Alteromonas sp. 1_MG-2023]|uniref:FKBP-type peptidyl-prolyl cis-trans isomerase n=1 Tax=Alteromonas sp. 1_MG-2023 TaxID=3062669 RepID=UPI0026E17608|nr:FKBP-type peptidyl-prolyl cis-trans isomerase [Alteromonas sp. 1_MG-2023]MDO6566856.1 FKBP-type peptidyl-prolyl cis-trans isomerase [Alteromonas sp. 1_MG-2023]